MSPAFEPPTPEFLALQTAVAGRFSIVRELGRGGMGIVFLARDLALDRLVAIKLLPPAVAAQSGARSGFLREARIAAALSHPNIVPLHLIEERGDLVYFVMTFIEGETLGDRVRRAGPLTTSESMRVIQEVAWALGHAHANGVIHHDIKPDNILLEHSTGRALVTDFGIARLLENQTPADGVLRGTPQYVSPEVASGGSGDARSDIYALGVTAWFAATGRHPFQVESVAALVLAHTQTEAAPIGTVVRVPARFADAVDRCLAKDPDARWPSADALAAEIEQSRARRAQVPAPARAFLRDWENVGGEVATAGIASAVAATEALVLLGVELGSGANASFDVAILKWLFFLIAVLTAALAKARIAQLMAHARATLRAGFSHSRLSHAQIADTAERADERIAVERVTRSQRRELLLLLAGSVLGTVGSLALAFSDLGTFFPIIGGASAVALPTIAIRTMWRLSDKANVEPLSSRILRGRIGKWFFGVAGLGVEPSAATAALEGPEPTEVALGDAARALHKALPIDVRATLGTDVPALIERLELQGERMRASPDDPTAAEGLRATIAALETLRLDLLRLSVGSITGGGLTTGMQQARALGLEIDRRLDAEAEVDQIVRRERTPTP